MPQVITHEKVLVDCAEELTLFLRAMDELGDRMHRLRVIVDRTAEMERWVPALARLLERDIHICGYFNNHYAGHAPGTITMSPGRRPRIT